MAQYQLKVMLNTSIPDKSGYIELTSDVLDYSPPAGKKKQTLVKFPFFDPTADYPRQEIQDLEYYKRLEVFFNEEKFKSMVIEFSNKKNAKIQKQEGGTDISFSETKVKEDEKTEDDKEKKLKEKEEDEKKISNFEFTIQTILCTGFPVNNYFQSMEYYDPSLRPKSLTLKGSSWFPFLPGRFDRKFSYLKIGGGTYTVSGIVWVNDALNHPKYLPVIESYGKYKEEKKDDVIEKKQNELKERSELEMNMFILNLYRDNLNQNSTVWRSANVNILNRKKQNDRLSMSELLSLDIQISFQEDVLKLLKYSPEIVNLFEELKVKDSSGNYIKDSSGNYIKDSSGNDIKFSSVKDIDISSNIFLMRGSLDSNLRPKNATDLDAIYAQPPENKAYFYWKMLHENVIEYDDYTINNKNNEKIKVSENNERSLEHYFGKKANNKGICKTKDHILYDKILCTTSGERQKYFKEIYDTYKKPQTFKSGIVEEEVLDLFLEDYKLKNTYKQQKNKKTEIYWLYKTLLENYDDIVRRKDSLTKKINEQKNLQKKINAYDALIKLIDKFLEKNKNVKEGLTKFLLKFSLADLAKLSNVTYKYELEAFVKRKTQLEIEKKTYTYVLSNTDFTDDPNKTQIETIIAEKFKHFNVFSSSLKELATTRIVANPYWKVETDKFVGVKKGKIVLQEQNKENLFEDLAECKQINSKCKHKKQRAEFLYTNLDELRFPVDKNAKSVGFQAPNVYEAYIQTNVIKGKITKENYGKLKCAYLNYSLGAMYQRMKKKTRDNYIIKNKTYFDLENEIKKADADLKRNPGNKTLVNGKKEGIRKSKKQGGGKKKHYTRKKKVFFNKTRKVYSS